MAARLPRPGGPVRGSATGRPLMAAMDLLGRRWALRILWELRDKPLGARALRSRCDRMSSSVLYERLDELTAAGLLTRDEGGAYLLTELGSALGQALSPWTPGRDAGRRRCRRQTARDSQANGSCPTVGYSSASPALVHLSQVSASVASARPGSPSASRMRACGHAAQLVRYPGLQPARSRAAAPAVSWARLRSFRCGLIKDRTPYA